MSGLMISFSKCILVLGIEGEGKIILILSLSKQKTSKIFFLPKAFFFSVALFFWQSMKYLDSIKS